MATDTVASISPSAQQITCVAPPTVDTRRRTGGIPVPQTLPEIEAVVHSALAKIDTVRALLEALKDCGDSVDSGVLIAPAQVLDQAAEELFNIEYTDLAGGRA